MLQKCEMIEQYNDVSAEDPVADCVLLRIITRVGVMPPPINKEVLYHSLCNLLWKPIYAIV